MTHNRLFSIALLLMALSLLPQCLRQKTSDSSVLNETEIYLQLLKELDTILYDDELRQNDLEEALEPFFDSVAVLARDEESLPNRLAAQMLAYSVINTLYDKYETSDMVGLTLAASSLFNAIGIWFYEEDEDLQILWHDLYYSSDKESDNPQDGYFHIMVLFPGGAKDEAGLHVFFPETAESLPLISFTKLQEGGLVDDIESFVSFPYEKWFTKDELREGSPMYGAAGPDIVEMMLTYDSMYLFFSRSQDPDDRSQYESARISLHHFQQAYKEHIKYLE